MVEIPEKAQAEALRALALAKERRDAEIARLDRLVRDAAVAADRTGASRTRIKQLAGVSSKTLYDWLAAAGASIRPKRPSGRRSQEGRAPNG
ncbi:hypothetical protein [Streptomyces sp. NPDC048516]|uniref:hypothetical protein n=1 Tax=Streptomyces sp. NPDC048516 TaxID=3365565 RepID=UPI003716FE1F